MNDFDDRLRALLTEGDDAAIEQSLGDKNVFSESLRSLKGPESGINILTWLGIMVFCGLLFFCIFQFFAAETTRDQIFYATAVILTNSAQIALKLWFHMRLNRRELLREIRRLQLAIVQRESIKGS
jgi:hypothetical protein